ncbi:hypothetical protein SUGI_0433000 [Cryptomeria japonica]|nr:hypothetical protein SUGI_0433000 [Cryptomeria japonica]
MSLHVAPWARVPVGHGGFPPDWGNVSWASVVKRGDGRERSHGRFGSPNERQGFRAFAPNAHDSRVSGFRPHSRPRAMPEQRAGSLPNGWRSPHGRDIWGPSTSNAAVPAMPTIVSLSEAVEKEVDHNELIFSTLGLIGRVKSLASWWKDVTPQSYTVEKVAGNLKSHQDVGGLINDSIVKDPELSNDGQGMAGGLVGASEGGFPKGCSSFQDAIGGVQMMEDGPSSQKGLNASMDEENHSENHCCDSKGLFGMEIQNLKSLEDAKSYGWIEVKRKKGKWGKDGNSCNDPPLKGGDGSGEVAP